MAESPRIVVVGAGAFGGWTALELRRRGARVILIDAWGTGHARSSAARRFRQIRFAGVSSVLFEPEAGYLFGEAAAIDSTSSAA